MLFSGSVSLARTVTMTDEFSWTVAESLLAVGGSATLATSIETSAVSHSPWLSQIW